MKISFGINRLNEKRRNDKIQHSEIPGSIFLRMARRILFIMLCILTAAAVIIPGVLSAMSPGIPKPFFDKNRKVIAGSISEKVWVKINGLKQGMIIKGKNKNNPVILFLHGGPGMPEYFLAEKYMTGLEDHFVICYWEQRGSGLSYNKNQTI